MLSQHCLPFYSFHHYLTPPVSNSPSQSSIPLPSRKARTSTPTPATRLATQLATSIFAPAPRLLPFDAPYADLDESFYNYIPRDPVLTCRDYPINDAFRTRRVQIDTQMGLEEHQYRDDYHAGTVVWSSSPAPSMARGRLDGGSDGDD